jgi:tetratricopeptide (TPR) repeat protein
MRVGAGASGAIFGIAGALISVLYFGQLGLQPEGRRKLLGYVVRFAFINLIFGLQAHIDNMAHLGGLVSGLLMGFFLARTFNLAPEERPAKRRMIFVYSAIVLLVLFVPVAKAKQYAVELGQGETALKHNDPNTAIVHLQKYVAARPDDAIGHALLGSAFQQTARFDDAASEFERSLAIEPDYPYAQVNLARIYVYQKKTDKALELFARGMARSKPDAPTFYMYAVALKDAGKLPEAESKVRRAIQLDPKYTDAHKLLAEVLTLEGKKEEAAAEHKRVEELGANAGAQPSSK